LNDTTKTYRLMAIIQTGQSLAPFAGGIGRVSARIQGEYKSARRRIHFAEGHLDPPAQFAGDRVRRANARGVSSENPAGFDARI